MGETYYERNKVRIKKEIKLRRKTDPEFRQAKIDAVNKSRRKKSEINKKLKAENTEHKKHWSVLEINGVVQECCDIKYLSTVINRSIQTIRRWERNGDFPPTFRYKERRFYTKKHFLMIVKFWEEFGTSDQERFFKMVKKHWKRCYN